jgi:hypothetical protein
MLLNTSKKALPGHPRRVTVSVQKMTSRLTDRTRGFTLIELAKTIHSSADPEDKKPAPADE